MDALNALHLAYPRSSTRCNALPRPRIAPCTRGRSLCAKNVNGPASSTPEDAPDDPPSSNIDAEAEHEEERTDRRLNGEDDELSSMPSCIPSKELLLQLRRTAELRRRCNDLAENASFQPIAEMHVHRSEVRVPSWAATAVTFAIAFSAGVVLAQFRGGLSSRNKLAVVDVRVVPSGAASSSCPEQLLGHIRAQEAPESDLKPVLADGSVRLRTAAAESFLRMQDAAREEGVWLIPISGFRSVSSQQVLFFDVKAERMESVIERAKTSAPPGYSEHHTGYAIDIGDPTDPDTYLRQEFEEGPAYKWLQQNAARFHFELSFSKDNLQGVMYEPWHWRFVGDDNSLVTFYAQHNFGHSFPSCRPS